ncbi:hypothetical protein CCACVL1_13378 [Corchorus capsularis]|uniref:Uncharacterized protein n=1 Tax=Corchorus capsularis TaxID=210143 RepID=A0A1R3IBA3_COCAP|nr:hypothetical protein CCACVL1_13378 [Corchorus capsularis]
MPIKLPLADEYSAQYHEAMRQNGKRARQKPEGKRPDALMLMMRP